MKTMLKYGLLCATLGLGLPAMAAMPESADRAAPAMTIDKAHFVKVVTSANAFEIRSSQLALEKASAPDVKAFAEAMVKDHQKAGADLQKAAGLSETGAASPALAPKHAAMLKELEAATGDEFQRLYIDMQTVAHMEAVTLFATYAGGGDDAAVKDFAAKTLPVLEGHKAHILKIAATP